MTAFLRLVLHSVSLLLSPLELATSDRRAGLFLLFKFEKDCHDVDNELFGLILLLLMACFDRFSRGTFDDNVFEVVDQKRPEFLRRNIIQVDSRACLDICDNHFAIATQDCLHAAVTVEPPFVIKLLETLSFSHHLTKIVASLAILWDLTIGQISHLFRFNAALDKFTSSFPFASLRGEDLLVQRCR